ncbi:MAG: sensor domain-containing diguanylate cyclase [Pseudomonadota bacterium]
MKKKHPDSYSLQRLARTMNDIEFIIERLKANEKIAQKFYEVETKILSILNFRDLFEVLLSEIREKFNVPYAWISIIEKSELSTFIRSVGSSDTLKKHLNRMHRSVFKEIVGDTMDPVLVNSNLKPFFKLFPKGEKYDIKSMAVCPISLHGEIVGSLNLADISESRFQPGLDVVFLENLSVKVSLCLSNVVAHEKLKFLAYHDPVTNLLNRRVMEDVLNREFVRSKRYQKSLSVVFIDLDDFKRVNDTYGHNCGDDLLKHTAKQLVQMCRETDVVTRFAGDEFVIILPETSAENASQLLARLVKNLAMFPLKKGGTIIPVAISYGVASTEDKAIKNYKQLLKRADQNLYQEKKKVDTSAP